MLKQGIGYGCSGLEAGCCAGLRLRLRCLRTSGGVAVDAAFLTSGASRRFPRRELGMIETSCSYRSLT